MRESSLSVSRDLRLLLSAVGAEVQRLRVLYSRSVDDRRRPDALSLILVQVMKNLEKDRKRQTIESRRKERTDPRCNASPRDLMDVDGRDAQDGGFGGEDQRVQVEKVARLRALRMERFGDQALPARRISRRYKLAPEESAMNHGRGSPHRVFRLAPIPEKLRAPQWSASQLPPTLLWVNAVTSDEARRLVALTVASGSLPHAKILESSPWLMESLVECVEDIASALPQRRTIRLASGTRIAVPQWVKGS